MARREPPFVIGHLGGDERQPVFVAVARPRHADLSTDRVCGEIH
jgi:hypothetical protein